MWLDQQAMFNFLDKHCPTHKISMEGNKIRGKRLIHTRSFSSFTITYLKATKAVSITTHHGRTLRYTNLDDMFCLMGAFSAFTDYKNAGELLKEGRA